MSTPREFGGAVETRTLAPITFKLAGQTFRATPKPPVDIIEALMAVSPDEQGKRRYAAATLIGSLERLVMERVWIEPTMADGDDGVPFEVTPGRWQPIDDRARMHAVLYGDEWSIPIETIAEIVMWIVEETTGDPTGAPKP